MLYSTKEHILLLIAKRAKKYDLEVHVNPTGESKETGFLLFVNDLDIHATMSYNTPVDAGTISFTMLAKGKETNYVLRVYPETFSKIEIEAMLDSIEEHLKDNKPKQQTSMGFLQS